MASSFISQPKVGMYTPPSNEHKSISTPTSNGSINKKMTFDPLAPNESITATTIPQESAAIQTTSMSTSSDRISSAFEGLSPTATTDHMSSQVGLPIDQPQDKISTAFEGLTNSLSTHNINNENVLQSTSTQSSAISTAFDGLSLDDHPSMPPRLPSSDKISSAYDQQHQRSKSSSQLFQSLKVPAFTNNIEQHQRSKSEIMRDPNRQSAKLSNELKDLSTELSSFFKEEKKQQIQEQQKKHEEERKEKFYKEVKKSFQVEGERQDRLSTLGLTPKASKKIVTGKEEKRRHDVLGISPKKIHKKVIGLSMSKLQHIKDERIATSARHCPENLIEEGGPISDNMIPPPPHTPPLSPVAQSTTPTTPSNTTSSEYEPSPHQLELSTLDEIITTCKICTFMENYRTIDQNFDLNSLLHIPLSEYNNIITNPTQEPILNTISNFGINDLILQGFFILDADDENTKDCNSRMECIIFSSEAFRKFYVCLRGHDDQQKKPIRNREIKTSPSKAKVLHPTQTNIKIHPSYHASYYTIEQKVFPYLQKLVESNPFFDVLFTGYSYGAGLAMIASVRYSYLFSMMRVYCNVYGCPKVGCGVGVNKWRDFVHFLSNLKVQRIEYGSDPYINLPEGSSTWVNAGHAIKISKDSKQSPKAYKFDKFRPHPNSIELSLKHRISSKNLKKKKESNDIHVYLNALEKLGKKDWVTSFVGEDGKGVKGKNDEKRVVV